MAPLFATQQSVSVYGGLLIPPPPLLAVLRDFSVVQQHAVASTGGHFHAAGGCTLAQ